MAELLPASWNVGGGTTVGTLTAHVVADTSKFVTGLNLALAKLKGFGARVNKFMAENAQAMRSIGLRATLAGAAVVAGVGGMVKTYGEFERRMRRATAVSEVTEGQFVEMSRMAEQAATDLNISATQAADAFYYLGSAGLSAEQQMKAFNSVALQSKAAAIDMDHVAEILVDVIKAYQKEFSEAAKITNIFTEAVISSNMTFSQFKEALKLVATIGKRTNNTIADMTAMLGLMADAGIKGTRAGTSLRRALLNIAAGSKEVRDMLTSWGVEVYDAAGAMKPMVQIIGELGDAMQYATEEQENFTFTTLFGVRAITGQLRLFDMSSEQVMNYVRQIERAGGASQKVADKQMKALLEQTGRVYQSLLKLARHIGQTLAPTIKALADDFGPLVNRMSDFVDKNNELVTSIVATAGSMGLVTLGSGILLSTLGNVAMIAVATKTSFLALTLALGGVTLGVGALVASLVNYRIGAMKARSETEALKKTVGDLEKTVSDSAGAWEKHTKILEFSEVARMNAQMLRKITMELRELEKLRRIAQSGNKQLMRETLEGLGADMPGRIGNLLTGTQVYQRWLNQYIEKRTEYYEDFYNIIQNMNDKMIKAHEDAEKDKTGVTKAELQKRMTAMEMASNLRQKARTAEYDDWLRQHQLVVDEWSYQEYRMVQDNQKALDAMEDGWTTFLADTMEDARNWKDHLVNFIGMIQRKMFELVAGRFAEAIVGWGPMQSLTSALSGTAGTGAGGTKTAIPIQERGKGGLFSGSFVPAAMGGIFRKPTLGLVAEEGVPEAVVPLKGGRNIPVEITGGGSGGSTINVNIRSWDGADAYRQFNNNRHLLARMWQLAASENNSVSRG
jgi:TP901 family phage tail tape measure protein